MKLSLCIEGTAALQPRQMLLKLLVLQLSSSLTMAQVCKAYWGFYQSKKLYYYHIHTVYLNFINVDSCLELFKMVCEPDEPDVSIGIPVVMLPQDAGESLKQNLQKNLNGKDRCIKMIIK